MKLFHCLVLVIIEADYLRYVVREELVLIGVRFASRSQTCLNIDEVNGRFRSPFAFAINV